MHVTTSNLPALFSSCRGVLDAIVDGEAGIERVQASGFHHARREVDGRDLRACARQRFGEQSAAASHIENTGARERAAFGDVSRTHGIELVQRFELAVDVPEAVRRGFEFRDFRGVAIARISGSRTGRS